tara:strand:+ start:44 stop:1711 length:1668 start_codon:yes stop_codon:yes gene_type:complete
MSNLIAACVGDTHVCPIKGHGSSPILPNGSSILVEGKPIARVGDVAGCGAVITQGYPLALADGMPVAYLGSPTSHGGSIVSGNPRVILGVATNTAPVVDFAMAGALDDKGQLTPGAKELRVLVQQQMDECLTANATGAMSEEECSNELSQILEGSYLNAETNVSKLERFYQIASSENEGATIRSLSVYVSGVGTKFGQEDDGWSMGTGLGERGILAKIEVGASKLLTELTLKTDVVDELVLDVFGFSRGASTARHFVNEVLATEDSALGQAFKNSGLSWPKTVSVRFLGVFDTVAAVLDWQGGDFTPHNDSNGPVNVSIMPEAVERAVHLVARHERRHNFSLNSLRGASGNLPEHFSEWSLPGVHSDIGGGYPDRFHEHIEVSPPLLVTGKGRRDPEASFEFSRMLQGCALVKNEGWIGEYNPLATLDIEQSQPPRLPGGNVTLRLWLDREVRGEYSRIPLYLMHKLAVDEGVPLKVINPDVEGLALPQELFTVARNLAAHVWYGNDLLMTRESQMLLRQRYMHYSDHYLKVGPIYPFRPAPYGKRVIHPNRGVA